jgi:hypothetical protein
MPARIVESVDHEPWPSWEMSNEELSVRILPGLGGKIASVTSLPDDCELLFPPPAAYRRRRLGDDFAAHDASGWDECFPCIDAETLPIGDRRIDLPDHGEVWTLDFSARVESQALVLEAEGVCLPYRYRRALKLEGRRIAVRIEIANVGDYAWPALWVLHALTRWEDDMELAPPRAYSGPRQVFPSSPALLRPDRGSQASPVLPGRGSSAKYWYELPPGAAACGLRFPSLGKGMRIEWNAADLPGLGLWMTNGGFRGDRNLAWEPANAAYDSVGAGLRSSSIPFWRPGETRVYRYDLIWG